MAALAGDDPLLFRMPRLAAIGTADSTLDDFPRRLLEQLANCQSAEQAFQTAGRVLHSSAGDGAVIFTAVRTSGQLRGLCWLGMEPESQVLNIAAQKLAVAATSSGRMQRQSGVNGAWNIVAAPVFVRGQPPEAIGIAHQLDASIETVLHVVAAHLSLWLASRQLRLEKSSEGAEVIARGLATADSGKALQSIAKSLAQRLGAKAILIAVRRQAGTLWLLAASDREVIDRRSEYGRLVTAACAEATLHSDFLIWPPTDDQRQLPTWRQFADHERVSTIIGGRLDPNSSQATVVLVLADAIDVEHTRRLLSEIAAPLSRLADIAEKAAPSILNNVVRRFRNRLRGRQRWIVLAVTAILLVAGAIPVPDRVPCGCTFQPQVRRFVVSPVDGMLAKALAKTGDQVSSGQPLALLDPQPLETELRVAQGEYDEALKRRDAARAKGLTAQAQLADIDASQAVARIEQCRRQLEQLTVASPIDGMIVRGDLERVEGAPLEQGQSLFEVAPLSPLIAELAIPEDEVRLVKPGMAVRLRPEAFVSRSLGATISRIHPQAEVRDRQSVFIAEVEIANTDRGLLPGMQARAVVETSPAPLAWTLVRRPYTRLVRWMWW